MNIEVEKILANYEADRNENMFRVAFSIRIANRTVGIIFIRGRIISDEEVSISEVGLSPNIEDSKLENIRKKHDRAMQLLSMHAFKPAFKCSSPLDIAVALAIAKTSAQYVMPSCNPSLVGLVLEPNIPKQLIPDNYVTTEAITHTRVAWDMVIEVIPTELELYLHNHTGLRFKYVRIGDWETVDGEQLIFDVDEADEDEIPIVYESEVCDLS